MRISLHLRGLHLPLLDDGVMHLLTMLSGSLLPIPHGALIKAEGMDNGLHWTAIGKSCHHDHNQFRRLAKPFQHGSSSSTKRLFTPCTAIALPFAVTNPNVALSDLASCRTRRVRAKLVRRVHRLCCTLLHKHIMPWTVAFFNPPPNFTG